MHGLSHDKITEIELSLKMKPLYLFKHLLHFNV